ncbi:MAG: ABC transporter substrate-binding protein [Frankiales bacterium]|nr:ABC transporter substrate-binding protein [Frankiales bacterium]
MRRPARTTRLLAALAVTTLATGVLLTGPASADDSSSPTPATSSAPTVFTVGMTEDIDSANPFTGIAAVSYEIFQMEYPTLTEYAASDFSTAPGLAESWTESADHKTWTYKIRSGLTWSDGQPLTAHDAAYTFNRILKGKYEQTNYSSYTDNIVKAVAPDDTTLVLTVKQPSPIMEKLAVYILPEHIWKNIDEKAVKSYKNEGTPDSPTVGAGPYVMVERRVGQFIRMQANPSFFRGKPAVDEVVFKIYKNQDALGQALKKGEIDFADSLEANVFKSLQNQPGITTLSATYSGFNELAFNTGAALDNGTPIGDGNPLLKDKKLRQALGWAIDRQTLVDKVLGGGGSVGSTIIPPMYASLHLDPADPVTYDPEKAKTLLDAAGYKVGPDGIRTDANGNRLEFRLFGRTDSSGNASQKAVQFIKGYLNAVGVAVDVKMMSSDNLTTIIGEGNFDMFEWGWVVEPDPNYQLSTFTCANRSYKDGGTIYANLSDSFYCNPAYDKLFQQQSVTTDVAARTAIVKQMQQMLYDDSPYIVTYYYDNLEAYRSDRFTGFVNQPSPDGSLLFQYGTWSYENMKPVVASAPASPTPGQTIAQGDVVQPTSSTNWALIIGIVVLVLLALGGGVWLGRGRNRDFAADDDRE